MIINTRRDTKKDRLLREQLIRERELQRRRAIWCTNNPRAAAALKADRRYSAEQLLQQIDDAVRMEAWERARMERQGLLQTPAQIKIGDDDDADQ